MSLEAYENIIVDNIKPMDYYNKMIVPLGAKYRPMTESNQKGVCPFHDDTDPSLMVWRGKSGKGKPIFNCFGCSAGGNVVVIHMLYSYRYLKQKIDKKQAIEQLASMWGITLPSIDELPKEESIFAKMRAKLNDSGSIPKGKLTLAEYRKTNKRVMSYKVSRKQKANAFNKLDIMMAIERINSQG